jgi:G3E family GTPase
MRPVAVDILSGFLGSGKTTLLSQLLDGPLANERVAVIMNEIGEVGVDARVLTGMEFVEDVVELNSGCICCTIEDYRFDLGIAELVERVDPNLILVECSGLADPGALRARVQQAGMANDAVITVVDAANFDVHLDASPVNKRQIEDADFLVVGKTDLVSERELAAVERRLARINKRALRLRAEHGKVCSDLILGTSAARLRRETSTEKARPDPSEHLRRDRIGAFVIREERALDMQRFQRFLEDLPRTVYRAKGFARVADNAWSCLFNFTCGRYELNWIKLGEVAGPTQAVFIGRDVEKSRARIERRLERCLAD